MPNLISVKQLRQNELTDFVNNLLSSGLSNVSGVSGIAGISGIYADYSNGIITIAYTGQANGSVDIPFITGYLATGDYELNNTVRTFGNQDVSGIKLFWDTGYYSNNLASQGDIDFNEVLRLGRYYSTESTDVLGFNEAPSHGIEFHRLWGGTITGKLGGIFAYPGQNWAGGLVFQTNDTSVGPDGPMKNVMVLQAGGNVLIGESGIANEKLVVDGFIQSSGFKSGITNIEDIFVNVNDGSDGGHPLDAGQFAQFNAHGQLNYNITIIPDLNHDIDKRIWGLTPSTGNKKIFSVEDHNNAIYVRNTGCWAYGIDLTPISVWNSDIISGGGVTKGGILISPRHVLMAKHYPITSGSVMRWVDNNNNVVTGVMGASTGFGLIIHDLYVGVLEQDVTGVSFAKVFPTGFTGYFNTAKIPLFYTDQSENALVGESEDAFGSSITLSQSSEFYRSGFYETPIEGDSGDPICAVVGNELIALSTLYTPVDSPYISYAFGNINACIDLLGNNPNNYHLTELSSKDYFPIRYSGLRDLPAYGSSVFYDAAILAVGGQIPIINPVTNQLDVSLVPTTGLLDPTHTVYTTGIQTISGTKFFGNNDGSYISIAGGDTTARIELGSLDGQSVTEVGTGYLILSDGGASNQVRFYGSVARGISAATVYLNFAKRTLSGNWLTNVNPTQSGNIVNLGYVTGSQRAYNHTSFSVYMDYLYTGNNFNEVWIADPIVVTGLRIGASTSGLGPAHLSSGVSGLQLFNPLTGNWYQLSTGNTSGLVAQFSFNSGEIYREFSIANTIVSGNSRLGLNIFSGLSGIRGVNFGIFGYLQ